MHGVRSPREAYRRVDFDARVAGADPRQLVLLCYEQLGTALGAAIHAAAADDNVRKSASLTRALAAITALQLGLDHRQPVAAALNSFFEAARQAVLDCVIAFDAKLLEQLRADLTDLSLAFRQAG
ncbi:MAG: flagellar protein FliS [Novosphingobium sp.]